MRERVRREDEDETEAQPYDGFNWTLHSDLL